jgi:predicted MFS family arabinose efflux permease
MADAGGERQAIPGGERQAIPREAVLLAFATFGVIAATNILTPLLPVIRDDFGVSIAVAGLIVGSYGLARLVVDLPAGMLAQRFGHRRLAMLGVLILVASSVLGWISGSVEVLIVSRIGSGAAVAMTTMVTISALAATAASASRGKVMSLFHVANNTGIALFPLVGAVVGAVIGWRATFGVTAALAIVAGAILFAVLPRIDFGREGTTRGGADESRVLHGRTRIRAFAATNVGVVANMIHRHGFRNTILPLYAATVLGLGGLSIATAIALMSVAGLLVATPGGMLGDRIGRRRVIVAGLMAVAAGDLVFLLTGDLVSFLLVATLIGLGDFFTSSQTALLSEIVPRAERTRALSTYRFSSDLGAMIGPILLALVMDLAGAPTAIVLAAAILAAAAIAAQLFVPTDDAADEPSQAAATA